MKRLMVLNLYFAPESFGGATVVAEQTVKRLQARGDWSCLVVTTMRDLALPPYFLRRYRIDGVNVVAINMPHAAHGEAVYRDPEVARCISEIASAFRPDVCHSHSIQLMGCEVFGELQQAGVKLAVTLHDCWWLCERQFMINADGYYCNQWQIDSRQCRQCVVDAREFRRRDQYLREQLDTVDLLLFPSDFHMRLHLANGIPAERSRVNGNGVVLPGESFANQQQSARVGRSQTVFGFVGGPGAVKGADHIVQACNAMERTDYTLKVVDAARNMGASWKDTGYWQIPGSMEFCPPYQQSTMDDFFSGIDVLLFPSQWKESFGLTVREALARNVWVIATDAGGVAEDLEHGVNATVLPFGSGSGELRAAMEEALDCARWRDYTNPFSGKIRGFDEQAQELSGYLEALPDRPNADRAAPIATE
ncbi:MAG: glycosyltransferase family 4 protein [Halioglobus sp.]